MEKSAANRLYFVHNKGLDLAVDLHRVLSSLSLELHTSPVTAYGTCRAEAHLGLEFNHWCSVSAPAEDKLDTTVVSVDPEAGDNSISICESTWQPKSNHNSMDHVLAETMYKGIGCLSKVRSSLVTYTQEQ